ncbi:hypothetical protein PT974_11539 [Cladobotryum mycophilum]|uniref:Uncharacterized protein n=1 Tax=Cladobotryum mycophilum TaxID=491253 RepID=A0ABR0S5I1_9HYPO
MAACAPSPGVGNHFYLLVDRHDERRVAVRAEFCGDLQCHQKAFPLVPMQLQNCLV